MLQPTLRGSETIFREPGGQGAEKAGGSHAQVRNDKVRWCVPFGDLPESETTTPTPLLPLHQILLGVPAQSLKQDQH